MLLVLAGALDGRTVAEVATGRRDPAAAMAAAATTPSAPGPPQRGNGAESFRRQQDRSGHFETIVRMLWQDLSADDARLAELFLRRLYDDMPETLAELDKIRDRLRGHQVADQQFMELGVRTLELARTLYPRFLEQEAAEKRKLLEIVLLNCTLKDGELTPSYRQPFGLLASAASVTRNGERLDLSDPATLSFWRPLRDSNPRHQP